MPRGPTNKDRESSATEKGGETEREPSIFLFFNNCEKLLFTPGGEVARGAGVFSRGAGWGR